MASKKQYLTFEEAREFARNLNFKSQNEWKEWSKSGEKPSNIPSTPNEVYKNKGWNGMGDFLGTGNIRKKDFLPFEEAREITRNLNLKSGKEWEKWSKSEGRPLDIPSNPKRVYENKGWISWGDFLGTGNVRGKGFCSFEEARKFVRDLNLKDIKEWKEWTKSEHRPPYISCNPHQLYKDKGWISWGDFLGTGTIASKDMVFLLFEEAREFARNLKLKNVKEWWEWSKSGKRPEDIPSNTSEKYKDKGWISWGDFLGTGNVRKKDFLAFEEAREFARNLKLKSSTEWGKWSKSGERPENIPANPNQAYKNKGWISWGDFLGISVHGKKYFLRN